MDQAQTHLNLADENTVILCGRLTHDPKTWETDSGGKKCAFAVATHRMDRSCVRQYTDYLPVVAWDGLAVACASKLAKGKLVKIEGHLRNRRSQTEGGETIFSLAVVAQAATFEDGTGATMDSEAFVRTPKETAATGQNEALSRAAAAFGGSVSQQGEVPY